MRPIAILSSIGLATLIASVPACSGSPTEPGFSGGSSSGGGSGGSNSSGGSSSSGGGSNSSGGGSGSFGSSSGSGGGSDAGGDAMVTVKTTVYAHTDDTLYTVDPMTKTVTQIGVMSGQGMGAITDLAVDAAGEVYVNSETTLYKAALPSSPGPVALTQVAAISGGTGKFYALAFTPAGALDPSKEILVGGDSSGSLYSIDTGTGTAKALGNFGKDASGACNGTSGCTFELSGDVVFYTDANNNPTGLATIRSCPTGSSSGCSADWLAGVDMTALKTAYTSGTAAASLLKGIYGGNGANLGSGTGFHDVFGLGAWDSTVFGFTRHMTAQSPSLITIDTTSGGGTLMGSPFSFTNGWSGAGVTTKVTIVVPPPPPPPPNNQ
jgi:hypothetical protein